MGIDLVAASLETLPKYPIRRMRLRPSRIILASLVFGGDTGQTHTSSAGKKDNEYCCRFEAGIQAPVRSLIRACATHHHARLVRDILGQQATEGDRRLFRSSSHPSHPPCPCVTCSNPQLKLVTFTYQTHKMIFLYTSRFLYTDERCEPDLSPRAYSAHW